MQFGDIGTIIQKTQVIEQFRKVDAPGLFTNPWFLVPFIACIGYLLYKKAFRDLIIVGGIMGMWYVSGTQYMQTLVVNGELQMMKVLPVMFGGAVVLGILIYLLISRSD